MQFCDPSLSLSRTMANTKKLEVVLDVSPAVPVTTVLRNLADNAPMVVWEVDAKGYCTYLNPSALNGLLSPGAVRFEDWVRFIHPDDAEYALSLVMRAREQGLEYQLEYRVVRSNGTSRWVMDSGSPRLDHDGRVTGYVGALVDVSEQHTTRLKHLSTQDVLTGLPNRQMMQERLQHRLTDPRGDLPQAILILDLHQFKAINEGLGRAAGDLALQEVAKRLREVVRANDLVSRLGSDEFMVVAECRNGLTSAGRVAAKIIAALSEPMIIHGREVSVSVAIGVSLYPQDGTTYGELFQNADSALYCAKASSDRSTQLRFYTAEMSTQSKSRMLLLSALRKALANDEFVVHYQPRVDLRSMEIVGMEALLRWNHPELGSVSPVQFIPVAEDAGLIEPIGAWVLEKATKQAKQWSDMHHRPFRMSVNVSARQLQSRRLVETVAKALESSGLPPDQLELELTETALMVDTDLAVSVLSELRETGVHLSVDDFGTGYSSLSYLSMFPLDCLKLDRSFLQARPDAVNPRRLAKAIISLAHTLNLTVVAEGVETREHLGFLRGAACDEIQGFCISVALPPDEFNEFIQKQQTSFRFSDSKILQQGKNEKAR